MPYESDNVGDFYMRIAKAETSGETDPWIRTRHNDPEKGGSSAFGEVQITKGLVQEALEKPEEYNLGETDRTFLQWLSGQQSKMLEYGGNDMVKGMEHYDYGGKGDFRQDQVGDYRQTIEKVMAHVLAKNSGDYMQSMREWRFGATGKDKINPKTGSIPVDSGYTNRFNS